MIGKIKINGIEFTQEDILRIKEVIKNFNILRTKSGKKLSKHQQQEYDMYCEIEKQISNECKEQKEIKNEQLYLKIKEALKK